MNGPANVRSLDSIEAVRAALVAFRDELEQALVAIDIEMRRMLDWLEHDRPRFWRTQVRNAADGVTEARAALHRHLMYPIAGERPSCQEERAALRRAEARRDYCEGKAERLRHWIREVQHEMFEYQGRIGQLNDLVQSDVPRAIAILDKLLARLHEYQAIHSPGGSTAAATVRRGGDPASPAPAASAAATDDAIVAELWPEAIAPSAAEEKESS